jgi:hypothetical protein
VLTLQEMTVRKSERIPARALALKLGVHRSTLLRLAAAAGVSPVRVGPVWAFSPADAERVRRQLYLTFPGHDPLVRRPRGRPRRSLLAS